MKDSNADKTSSKADALRKSIDAKYGAPLSTWALLEVFDRLLALEERIANLETPFGGALGRRADV